FLEGQDPVRQVSIIPRGMAGGYTMSVPTEDKSYKTKNGMLDDIVVLLGGRVAEKLVLGDISTGASNDIERATKIAKSMVTEYGMSDRIGPVSYSSGSGEVFLGRDYGHAKDYSEAFAQEIDEEISRIIHNGYDRTETILTDHMDKLHELAQYLIKHEKINADDFKKLMEGELKTEDEASETMKSVDEAKSAAAAEKLTEEPIEVADSE
ncbi:MAG: ATP-dependent zinc metalloprotease FtsH, partial [Clostridia bacterium]|nr:ATP-dependent zinc metalloprotease FtsH [Clostridia bacterium]